MSDPQEYEYDDLHEEDAGDEEADGDLEPSCEVCHEPLMDEFYRSGPLVLCPSCRDEIDRGLRSGSRVARFLRANLFGFGAAVAGFALYFGLLKMTGYEVGLVSILVGLMVGGAVKLGSRRRGGWLYQLVAMFWVYTAIGVSYSSILLPDMFAEAAKDAARNAEPQPVKPGEANAAQPADPPAQPANPPAPLPSFGELLGMLGVLLLIMLFFVYTLPIVAGIHAPMGLFLIAIALWEAWKINRKVPIILAGPFPVGET